jgi:hypothetical protein
MIHGAEEHRFLPVVVQSPPDIECSALTVWTINMCRNNGRVIGYNSKRVGHHLWKKKLAAKAMNVSTNSRDVKHTSQCVPIVNFRIMLFDPALGYCLDDWQPAIADLESILDLQVALRSIHVSILAAVTRTSNYFISICIWPPEQKFFAAFAVVDAKVEAILSVTREENIRGESRYGSKKRLEVCRLEKCVIFADRGFSNDFAHVVL